MLRKVVVLADVSSPLRPLTSDVLRFVGTCGYCVASGYVVDSNGAEDCLHFHGWWY